MSLTISQAILNTNDRVAGLRTLLGALVECFFDCRNILVRDVLTLSLVNELAREISIGISGILIDGFKVTDDTGELTGTSRLLFVEEIKVCLRGNSFSVVHSGISNLQINIVLTLHAFTIDEQVKLAHTRDNDFLAFHVLLYNEGRILALESGKSLQENLELVGLLGLDRERHDGVRDVHLLHSPVETLVAESLTRGAIDTKNSKDITSTCLIDIFHFI